MSQEPPVEIERMTGATARVLGEFLINPRRKRYAHELVNTTRLKGGTVYPLLARLAEQGVLMRSEEEAAAPGAGPVPRRYYRLTEQGRRAAVAALIQWQATVRRKGGKA